MEASRAYQGPAIDVLPESAAEEPAPKLQGLIHLDEQSIVRGDCVRKRWAVLTDQGLIFSRTEQSSKKKLWNFHHRCTVQPDTGVQQLTCRVLHSRYMVLSLSYKHSKQTLYCFTVSWPARASPSQTKRSRLLAFREEADATKWHEAITAAISAQALPETPSQAGTPGIPATPTAEFFQQDIGPRRHSRTVSLSAMPSPLVSAGSVNFGGPEDHLNTPRRLADSDVGHNAALGALRTPGRTSHGWGAHTVQQRNSGQGVRLSQDRNAPAPPGTLHSGMSLETEFANTDGCGFVGAAHESTDTASHKDHMKRENSAESFVIAKTENMNKFDVHPNLRAWGRFHLMNGLAIWKQGSGHSSAGSSAMHADSESASSYCSSSSVGLDTYMVSKRIRGTPGQVVKSLLRLDGRGSCFWAFDTVSNIQALKSTDQEVLFKATMAPPNALQDAFASHRDFFLQRCCRKDDDESYVVLLHSIDRETHKFKATPGNVEGRIASMGFTVAPLKPVYRHKMADRVMDSHECLVTLVLSADVGGWLGAHSPLSYCFPFWRDLENSWLQKLLMTLVALGNKVDQDCFVKGEEDMVDSAFKLSPTPFASNGAGSYPTAPSSADDTVDGAGVKVGRAASGRAAAAGGAADNAGGTVGGAAVQGVPTEPTKIGSEVLGRTSALPAGGATAGMGGLDSRYYSDPRASNFSVRGKNYLVDKKKFPSEEPLFRLVAVDLVKTDAAVYHISRYLPLVRKSSAPFSFVLCFTLPYARRILSMVLIFEADEAYGGVGQQRGNSSDDDDSEEDESQLSPFDLCLARFLADKGPLRDAKLKLIPSLAQGSWMIRQAVGQTPVMLGKRLKTQYFMENAYVEADIDISANATAAGITSMVAGSIKNLVFDIGILLEGHSEEELPERLLGSARLNHLDLRAARELDMSAEIPAAQRPVPKGFFDETKRNLSVSVPASAAGSAPPSASVTPTPSTQGVLNVY